MRDELLRVENEKLDIETEKSGRPLALPTAASASPPKLGKHIFLAIIKQISGIFGQISCKIREIC